MRRSFKHLASLVLIPLVQWYLRKERYYTYRGIKVSVLPGVFHPGLFSSTKFILEYLFQKNLKQKTFLELGCGTGLISIVAAKAGARVAASDINLTAIRSAQKNALQNAVTIISYQSDLFNDIPKQFFDLVVINPPYYAKTPTTEATYAWYCGENFEYFRNFFTSIGEYIHPSSTVLMVLTKGCDLDQIFSIAEAAGFELLLVKEKNVLFDEKDYLYEIRKVNSSDLVQA